MSVVVLGSGLSVTLETGIQVLDEPDTATYTREKKSTRLPSLILWLSGQGILLYPELATGRFQKHLSVPLCPVFGHDRLSTPT